MAREQRLDWDHVEKWVRIYSYITVVAVIYGLAAAHVPFIIGIPWSTCLGVENELACVLTFHLYEVPLTLFNIYVAWYGLKRFSQNTLHNYTSLLTFAVVGVIAFFTFECQLVVDILRRNAPEWELLVACSLAFMMIAGGALAVYVKQKLVTFTYQGQEL